MRLWDYNLEDPVPIRIEEAMSIDAEGTLRAIFEDGEWGSTLTFDAGIPVTLAGTLELLLDSDARRSLEGTTFQVFDWTGVSPLGAFDAIATSPGLTWDTSQLYTTGEVTLVSVVPEPTALVLALLASVSFRPRLLDFGQRI